jgi:aminoglycoside phosphotransferase (APT) family kinase protein
LAEKDFPEQMFERVAHKLAPQSKLLRSWELNGGISAQVTALEIEQPDGQRQKLIVRRHGAADLQHNPQIAADEFTLLRGLHSAGLAVPRPYDLDQSGEIFTTPYVVLEYIEGQPEFAPAHLSDFLLQVATQLARIHQVDGAKLDLSFLPQQEDQYTEKLRTRPAQVDESLDEGRIRDTLEAVWPLPPRNPSVLLHGDFWPGNLLWQDGRLVGVIDWEDAALGDPLADLANSRIELLWAFGIDAMQQFTQQYQAQIAFDCANLPYWDLSAALRHAAHAAKWATYAYAEHAMREGYRWFVTQAFEQLSVQGKPG